MHSFRLLPAAVALALALALALTMGGGGCSKPEPPVLTPKSVSISKVSLTGVDVVLRVEATNPNTVALSARGVAGKVVLDGKYDLGVITVPQAVNLPASATTVLDLPLSAKWSDLTALATLGAQNRAVPYTFDGTVNVGGASLNVDLPFHVTGTITHEELVQATMRSLPTLPGFPLPTLPR